MVMLFPEQRAISVKSSIVIVRVTQETKVRLSAIANLEGVTSSDVIRRMIDAELGLHPEAALSPPKLTAEGYKRKHLSLTLPTFIADLAKERATMKGMSLSRWMACLIQSHVYQPPVLTTTELKVLNESNRQIRAMGVNINQIARAFNTMDVDIRRLKDFYLVENLLKENLGIIDKLLRAANRSWGIDRGSD